MSLTMWLVCIRWMQSVHCEARTPSLSRHPVRPVMNTVC